MLKTTYLKYRGVSITVAKNGTAFVDYQNTKDVIKKIGWRFPDTTRKLLSDPNRYRVYYPKNSLGKLFTDIEAVMI